MGQAFDGDGKVLGEASGATKREVLEKLLAHPDAAEVRIRTFAASEKLLREAASKLVDAPAEKELEEALEKAG